MMGKLGKGSSADTIRALQGEIRGDCREIQSQATEIARHTGSHVHSYLSPFGCTIASILTVLCMVCNSIASPHTYIATFGCRGSKESASLLRVAAGTRKIGQDLRPTASGARFHALGRMVTLVRYHSLHAHI
jgi:hypothetical protein